MNLEVRKDLQARDTFGESLVADEIWSPDELAEIEENQILG